MRLPQFKNHKWNYLALSFWLPFICFLMIMVCGRYEPFGNNRSMLYSDMYHQYFPFFVNFREVLRSGGGLLYNWDIGMGLDYLGLYSYYLGSPLNLISALLPESLLLEYFSLLVPLKLALASVFFAYFLKSTFRQNDLFITLFGAFYGLCAWALGYQWNVMWLDTFALLPLVILGTLRLLRDRKFILYTLSLFLSVAANYYIGFFTCIFVFLFFFCYQLCRCKSIGRFFTDLCTIALFSVLAIGMTAFLELPTLAALQNSYSSVNKFPDTFRLNIADEHTWKGLLDAMRQVTGNMGGGLEPTFKEGLPNLYCGVGSVFLAVLYLLCGQIKLRDRICCVTLLLFFNVSFIIRQLDYIWHGFHFTNMIPYRFSYLYSAVILYMAYKAWLLRRRFKLWQIILSGILSLGIFLCSDSRTDPVFIAYNLIFFLLYLIAFLYPVLLRSPKEPDKLQTISYQKSLGSRRSIAALAVAGIMFVEMIINVVNFGIAFPYTGISSYPKGTTDAESAISYMQENDAELFYRAEVTHSQTLNDGALNGYHGISTFTSSANVKVTSFMQALGYGAKESYNRYCFEESSPVSNLFLGLKYMMERDGNLENNPYFDAVYTSNTVTLLKNNAYLPLGFLTQVQLSNVDFTNTTKDAFGFQNKLLSAASGITEPVWYMPAKHAVTITSEDVEVSPGSVGYCTYTANTAGTVTYTILAEKEGFMCVSLNLPKRNSYKVDLNGENLFSETYSIPQTAAISYVEPGDVVQIHLSCKADEKSNMTIRPAILDDAVFRSAYSVLNASTLELTAFSTTSVAGTINCDRDGLLYTSIPQNRNWSVLVDGQEADIVLVGNCMIGIPLAEGQHSVIFWYENQAYNLGWKITLACAFLFIGIALVVYLPEHKHKKGKYER